MRIFVCLSAVLALASAHAQDVTLAPVTGSSNFRFKDVLGQTFSAAYIGSYSYSDAHVGIVIDASGGNYPSGTITGTGLKPNFAYQVKLVGRPSKMARTPEELAAADDATNERLGKIGRWWREQPSPGNSNDADYDANKDTPGYIYQGYLLMAFFVTDETGAVNTAFTGNNSYHVLWRVDQRARSANDGPSQAITLPPTAGNAAYDVSLGSRGLSLYGEWEPTRALPGQLQMPLADYHATLLLTEESFHDFSANSGNWTAAMSAPLDFSIPTNANTPVSGANGGGSEIQPLAVERLRAGIGFITRGRDVAVGSFALELPPEIGFDGKELVLTLLGVSRAVTLNTCGRGRSGDVRVSCRRDRRDPKSVRVQATIRRASLVLDGAAAQTRSRLAIPVQLTLAGMSCQGTVDAQVRANEHRVWIFR